MRATPRRDVRARGAVSVRNTPKYGIVYALAWARVQEYVRSVGVVQIIRKPFNGELTDGATNISRYATDIPLVAEMR